MIKMMVTTISNSMRENPFWFLRARSCFLLYRLHVPRGASREALHLIHSTQQRGALVCLAPLTEGPFYNEKPKNRVTRKYRLQLTRALES